LGAFKLSELSSREIDSIINEQIICRIGFRGGEYPSMSLFQYTRIGDSLFFHFTEYGNKLESLETDNRVCVEIEDLSVDLGEFRFVLLKGRLQVVVDEKKKEEVVRRLAVEGKKRLSEKFLAAHGFGKGSDWSTFENNKSMIIVEFLRSEALGLRSP
jgi:nitroimidazol reductase NimA-like FMN-containing flavoprotein (pyridoxamine 5'-phosphate oxidase superfamily)